MILIAGLGNPGEKYRNTRHNIGFRITGEFAEKSGIVGKFHPKFDSILGKGKIKDKEILIVQPQTYMNLSGDAVRRVMDWYKIEIKDVFVVFDDITLDLGRIRFRPSGTAGNHNGIKSIISSCGSDQFPRLKVGIGPNPGENLWKNYVLEKFSKEEQKYLPEITDVCVEAIELYLIEGIESARNKYNGINIIEEIPR
ncbi:MAG: aminoacyl-tRNA hydrolase [bacterium]